MGKERKTLRNYDIKVSQVIIFAGIGVCAVILFLMLLVLVAFMLPVLPLLAMAAAGTGVGAALLDYLTQWKNKLRSLHIKRPPGILLLRIVSFVYSRKAVEEIYKPILADWLTEYYESLNEGKSWKARWISFRYIYSFILAMGLSKVFAFVKSLYPAGR